MGLRSSIGIAVQLPFFIAAYHLLSHYPHLKGSSFLFIHDLGSADSLLKIGSISVNVLPLAMTATNLVSSFVYCRNEAVSFKEKIQLLAMALLFLVLLYLSPAGLLIYWTSNNIFSLLKNILYRLAEKAEITSVFNCTPLVKARTFMRTYSKWFVLSAFSLLQFLFFLIAFTSKRKILFVELLPALIIFLYLLIRFMNRYASRFTKDMLPAKTTRLIFYISFLQLCALLFLFNPVTLLFSGNTFDFPMNIFVYLAIPLYAGAALLYGSMCVYKRSSEQSRIHLSILLAILSVVMTVNSVFFSGRYGDMSNFIFDSGLTITLSDKLISFSISIALACLIYLLLKKGRYKAVLAPLTLSFILLFILSVYYAKRFDLRYHRHKIIPAISLESEFTLSSKNPNVIVLMLDRFIGSYFQEIMNRFPEIRKEFEGFTWYPNAVSPSPHTIGSVPAIWGGYEYTANNLTLQRKDIPLVNKFDESIRILPANFLKAGMSSVIISPPEELYDKNNSSFFDETDIRKIFGKYSELLKKEKNISNIDTETSLYLLMYSFFRAAPPCVREIIYDDGGWMLPKKSSSQTNSNGQTEFISNNAWYSSMHQYSFLYYLPQLYTVSDNDKGTCLFIDSEVSHNLGAYDHKGELSTDKMVHYLESDIEQFHDLYSVKHLYADIAAIKLAARFIRSLKENGLYDTTRIIIVSDHGKNVYSPAFERQNLQFTQKPDSHILDVIDKYTCYNVLFLVKDYNRHGELRTDASFMTCADVPSIATNQIVNAVNPFSGSAIEPVQQKTPFDIIGMHWRLDKQEQNGFAPHFRFRITDPDIFNTQNWQQLTGD